MSLFNGAGILGDELGAGLTELLGVKAAAGGGATDFTNLPLLVGRTRATRSNPNPVAPKKPGKRKAAAGATGGVSSTTT